MEFYQTILIREMRAQDAYAWIAVHHAAVRGIAARDYSPEIVDEWAPLEISQAAVDQVIANLDGEIRLVAESNGELVGIAAVIPKNNELRACYVSPQAVRKKVGTLLIARIEQVAKQRDSKFLELESSITAEPFYAALGYVALERREHVLSTGGRMASVKMKKTF